MPSGAAECSRACTISVSVGSHYITRVVVLSYRSLAAFRLRASSLWVTSEPANSTTSACWLRPSYKAKPSCASLSCSSKWRQQTERHLALRSAARRLLLVTALQLRVCSASSSTHGLLRANRASTWEGSPTTSESAEQRNEQDLLRSLLSLVSTLDSVTLVDSPMCETLCSVLLSIESCTL